MERNNYITGLPRSIEVFLAGSGLLILSPVLLLVAFLIKITDDGPVIFSQQRIGQGGARFTLYKFRTMRCSESGPLVTAATDNRITHIGKLLRKTKIDELPELWNILRGEMSFVGPRPEVPQLVNLSDPTWKEILRARPGLTDPITLRLRNEETLMAEVADKELFYKEVLQPFKMKGYADFVKKRSFIGDIKIICQTLKVIVFPNAMSLPTREEIRLSVSE